MTLASYNSLVWCWYGRAVASVGEVDEARRASGRAIELERAGSYETDAPDLLQQLEG